MISARATSAGTPTGRARAGGVQTYVPASVFPYDGWYDRKPSAEEEAEAKKSGVKVHYRDRLKILGTFNTVEDFWSHYVYLRRPSELSTNVNIYMFREKCFPSWESYPTGGCWILKLNKAVGVTSKLWQDLLFATIGEMFDDLNVVGVTMSIRSSRDMLSVWNKDNNNPETKFRIGEKLKQILGLQESATVEYKNHRDSMKDYSTYKNGTAFVYTPKLGASASPAITAASPGLTASAAPFVSRSPALGAGATLAEMALLSLEPPALAQAV